MSTKNEYVIILSQEKRDLACMGREEKERRERR
jgi:hypothetical protein